MYSFIPSFIKHWFESMLVRDPVLGTGGPVMTKKRKPLQSSLVGETNVDKISRTLVL